MTFRQKCRPNVCRPNGFSPKWLYTVHFSEYLCDNWSTKCGPFCCVEYWRRCVNFIDGHITMIGRYWHNKKSYKCKVSFYYYCKHSHVISSMTKYWRRHTYINPQTNWKHDPLPPVSTPMIVRLYTVTIPPSWIYKCGALCLKNLGLWTLLPFSVTFCCLPMPFCECPCKKKYEHLLLAVGLLFSFDIVSWIPVFGSLRALSGVVYTAQW